MSNGTTPINIQVGLSTQGSVIDVSVRPPSARVPNNGKTMQLNWSIPPGGTTAFPTSQFFSWKAGTVGAPNVQRKSDVLLQSDSFTNPSTGPASIRWEYTIGVTNGTVTVLIDPEVDNEPPGGGGAA